MPDEPLIAGVELGGTKAVAILAHGSEIIQQKLFPTTSPSVTLAALHSQLSEWRGQHSVAALGIAAFGPVQVNRASENYGCLLKTPKPGWSQTDIGRALTTGFDWPWRLDTDVNAAALAEMAWGAAKGIDDYCYLTIGTGVGGGFVSGGVLHHGALHPEVGHLALRRAPDDSFEGICPFHSDCVEGLISGPAIRSRFNCDPQTVDDDDPRWAFVLHDLTELLVSITYTISPQKILIGGGVGLSRQSLLRQANTLLVERISAYLPHYSDCESDLVGQPGLGADAGPLGAIALGAAALANSRQGAQACD